MQLLLTVYASDSDVQAKRAFDPSVPDVPDGETLQNWINAWLRSCRESVTLAAGGFSWPQWGFVGPSLTENVARFGHRWRVIAYQRDAKPGRAICIDFGVAKRLGRTDTTELRRQPRVPLGWRCVFQRKSWSSMMAARSGWP